MVAILRKLTLRVKGIHKQWHNHLYPIAYECFQLSLLAQSGRTKHPHQNQTRTLLANPLNLIPPSIRLGEGHQVACALLARRRCACTGLQIAPRRSGKRQRHPSQSIVFTATVQPFLQQLHSPCIFLWSALAFNNFARNPPACIYIQQGIIATRAISQVRTRGTHRK